MKKLFGIVLLAAIALSFNFAFAAQNQAQNQNQNQNTNTNQQQTQSNSTSNNVEQLQNQNQNQNQNRNRNFTDVPAGAWYSDDVEDVAGWGIMIGNPDNSFAPSRYINRAEMAAMMVRFRAHLQNQFQLVQSTSDISVVRDESFNIVLEANPTTGYEWQVNYDHSYLELTDRNYEVYEPDTIGGGGEETFTFKGLKPGVTYIYFLYLRSFDVNEPPISRYVYKVVITEN